MRDPQESAQHRSRAISMGHPTGRGLLRLQPYGSSSMKLIEERKKADGHSSDAS